MSDFKLLFIHGYTASSKADWYPRLTKMLDELGVDYVVPDLPGAKRPHSREWLEIVDREVKKSDKPVVLIGHSLGSRTVLLYLDQYKQPVKAVFLIAAFANWTQNAGRNGGKSYPDFFEYAVDIPAIKQLCDSFTVLHSVDDDGIDYQQAVEITKDLDAKLVTVEGRGHLYKPKNAELVLQTLRDELHF
jgi:predicted alpha/beta hydrolase family esterase